MRWPGHLIFTAICFTFVGGSEPTEMERMQREHAQRLHQMWGEWNQAVDQLDPNRRTTVRSTTTWPTHL